MPLYQNTQPPNSLSPGDVLTVWNAEQPAIGNDASTGSASIQVALAPKDGGDGFTPFSVDLKFAGAPGAFEVDAQVAQLDVDGNYQTVLNGAITVVDAVHFTAHFVANVELARFARLLMKARANAVNVTATIRR